LKEAYDYLNSLLKENDTVVFGCSYGPDSMALFHLLLEIRKKKNLCLVCAHVNHHIRKASEKEYEDLKRICERYQVVFEPMTITNYGDDNFHNEARHIRYRFFDDLVMKYQAHYLMTAHHGDDLMETILMRLVRGSTFSGYHGFSRYVFKDSYYLVRPLITASKEEILLYDKKHRIPYCIDRSNFSSKYTRNRYRKAVLPFLKKEDAMVHLKFLKYSNLLASYDAYIEKEMEKAIERVYHNGEISIALFRELDPIIQDKVIHFVLKEFYQDDLILIRDVHVDLIKKLLFSGRANSFIYLPNDIKVIKSYGNLRFSREIELLDHYEIELSDTVFLPNQMEISFVEEAVDRSNNSICLLKEDLSLPLHVRTRKFGDKMEVKGLRGTKKIKDIFIDAKIPLAKRDLWPIVVDSKDRIVWIPGVKKSKLDIPNQKKCDIILWYHEKGGKK